MWASPTVALTGNGSGRQHHGLKPRREEVHYGEVTKGDQEIAGANKDRNFLFEQKRCQDGFDGEFQLDDQEKEEKHAGDHKGRDDSHVVPLFKH